MRPVDLSLEIAGDDYDVSPVTPGTNADGFTVRRVGVFDGEVYTVTRDGLGLAVCTCADFRLRRHGRSRCKHVDVLLSLGMLGTTHPIDQAAADQANDGAILCKAAGTTFRNDDGRYRQTIIAEHLRAGRLLEPRREPTNKHDPNAVALWATLRDGRQAIVGYLPAAIAKVVSPAIAADWRVTVEVAAVTGGGRGSADPLYGLNLAIRVSP